MAIKSLQMSFKELKVLKFFKRTQKMLLLEFFTQKHIQSFLIRENYFQIANSMISS